jgi:hypothetical protein
MQRLVKNFGIPLIIKNAEGQFTYNEKGQLIAKGFFTSDNKDEVGDIITRAATENAVPIYRQWGNIRYMHQPRPVAAVQRIGAEDGLEWNEVEIRVVDPDTKLQVEEGLLKALSVGIYIRNFDAIEFTEDGGLIINEYGLAEISLVDHPANYDAKLESGEKTLPWKNVVNPVEGLTFAKALAGNIEEEDMAKKDLAEAIAEATEEEVVESVDNPTEEVEEITASVEAEEVEEEAVSEETDEEETEVIEENRSVDSEEEDTVEESEEVVETEPQLLVYSLSDESSAFLVESITRSVVAAVKDLLEDQSTADQEEVTEEETAEVIEEVIEEEEVEDATEKRIKALEDRLDDAISTATTRGAFADHGDLPNEDGEEDEELPTNLVERAKVKKNESSVAVIKPRTTR